MRTHSVFLNGIEHPATNELLFEIIDPYSLNRQGPDFGLKYRTGVYSKNPNHLREARDFIDARQDSNRIVVEVLPLLSMSEALRSTRTA